MFLQFYPQTLSLTDHSPCYTNSFLIFSFPAFSPILYPIHSRGVPEASRLLIPYLSLSSLTFAQDLLPLWCWCFPVCLQSKHPLPLACLQVLLNLTHLKQNTLCPTPNLCSLSSNAIFSCAVTPCRSPRVRLHLFLLSSPYIQSVAQSTSPWPSLCHYPGHGLGHLSFGWWLVNLPWICSLSVHFFTL